MKRGWLTLSARAPEACLDRRRFLERSLASCFSVSALALARESSALLLRAQASLRRRNYSFHQTISREVLDNYLSRSISMEGLLNGRGDLTDNIRMLARVGAKYAGR